MKINIADIRQDYSKKELRKKDCQDHPTEQFNVWLQEAIDAEVVEPTAMTLATADKDGRPSSRTVLLKGVEDNRFIFYTNYKSRKGSQLVENPYASISFFWKELERQVNVEGTVTKVAESTSDEYFASRPYKSRVGAWASEQSKEISSKNVIKLRFVEYSMKHITNVPRPPHWGGYAIDPERVEFWQGRPSRLHDRIVYEKQENGLWAKKRVAP
ncbi:pyridoxamine 5'-phosphate oxidase [Fulvitalea axinellae]